MKRWLPYLIICAVGLIAAVSGVLLYRANKPATLTSDVQPAKPAPAAAATAGTAEQTPPPTAVAPSPAIAEATEAPAAETEHVRGPADAPVTIEEYGDFQCPPCGMLSEPLNQIERDFSGKVRLIFHHYPLEKHLNARRASQAAEAAALQGHFWEMHDLLYKEQEAWSKAMVPDGMFVGYATKLGLDAEKFRADMWSPEVDARVSADEQRADKLGVKVTPTVFVNGKSLNLSQGPASVRAAVESALAEVPAKP
jgi:protein-disulfide isomerase